MSLDACRTVGRGSCAKVVKEFLEVMGIYLFFASLRILGLDDAREVVRMFLEVIEGVFNDTLLIILSVFYSQMLTKRGYSSSGEFSKRCGSWIRDGTDGDAP